ncbi:MAG TPA: Gfo/Idh/MocA family oxidoreductase [Solirubrobacteraceae bacterium]|jgi:predicted dehydrogenase
MDHSGRPRIRLGIAGGGLISQVVHLPTLRQLDDRFEVVGLADPSPAVRERVAARHGIARTFADHRQLLAQTAADALLVCAPNGLHAEITLDALDAGLHVLVEKPLCLTVEDADRIAERRDAAGRVVQVAYMKRFDAAYEALRDGMLEASPEVLHVSTLTVDPGLSAQFRPPGFVPATGVPAPVAQHVAEATAAQALSAAGAETPADVAAYSDACLGALVHDVNAVHGLLCRPPARVIDGFAGPDAAGGTVEIGGGARWTMAWLLAPRAGRFSETLRLVCDDGVRTLRFGAPYLRNAPAEVRFERACGAVGALRTAGGSYADAYTRELEHFHDCVTAGTPCRTPPEQARADVDLLARLFRAHLEARVAA